MKAKAKKKKNSGQIIEPISALIQQCQTYSIITASTPQQWGVLRQESLEHKTTTVETPHEGSRESD